MCSTAEPITSATASFQARYLRRASAEREPDQQDPEREREHARRVRDTRRQHAAHEARAVRQLRGQRGGDSDRPGEEGAERQHGRG